MSKKTTFSDTTKPNDGRAIDFSVKTPRLDSYGQQIHDRFGNPRFKKEDPYKWIEYLQNAGAFKGSFIKYDFDANKFKYVLEKTTNQEFVSYADMVMSNIIDTLFDGSTYEPYGESHKFYIRQTQMFEEIIRLRSLYTEDNMSDDKLQLMLAECKRRY